MDGQIANICLSEIKMSHALMRNGVDSVLSVRNIASDHIMATKMEQI